MSTRWMLCGEDIVATKYNGGRHVEVHGPVERLQEGEDHREGDLGGVVDLPQVLRRVLGDRSHMKSELEVAHPKSSYLLS